MRNADVATFEVEVEAEVGKQHYGYYPRDKGVFIKNKIRKMFNFENVSRDLAIKRGQKLGKVVSCRKVQAEDALAREVEGIADRCMRYQDGLYAKGNQFKNAMAMDDMIWQKKLKK
jgi:hypothetical protein